MSEEKNQKLKQVISNNADTQYFFPYCLINSVLIFLFIALLFIIFMIIDTDIIQLCLTILIFISCTAWGHVTIYPIFYKNNEILCGFIWGCVSGTAISSLIISVIVYYFGWNISVIFIVVTGVPAVIFLLLLTIIKRKPVPSANSQFIVTLILAGFAVVTTFFIFPYKNLGVLVGDKYLYTWLFGHDFINRLATVESLSRGIPLQAMFFSGETLSYYWLSYVFPALMRNLEFINLEIKQLLQLTLFFYSLLATAALVIFLKNYVHQKKVLIVSVILALCSYSFVWILMAGRKLLFGLTDKNIFPISEKLSMDFSGFSHGLYRFFLVEPQGVLFIAIMLMIFTLYSTINSIYAFIVIGVLLGISFGVEATNCIMLVLWFGGLGFFSFVLIKEKRKELFIKHAICLSCSLFFVMLLFSIEMYSFSTGQEALQVSPNWFALKSGIAYFPMAYGPPFILGLAGLILLLKKREPSDHWVYSYVLLLGIALFFVFFIQNPTEYHFGLLKATRVIPICLIMLSVYFLKSRQHNRKLGIGVFLLIAISFPTLITDNKIASDISNPSTFVRMSDMEAAQWIKENLPEDAVVQAEPNYPGPDDSESWPLYAYSFIPVFAERITAVGEWKVSHQAHAVPGEVSQRFHDIKRMYSTTDVYECIEILRRLNINFIYVGELEKQEYPGGVNKFENKRYFESIYHNTSTSIYRLIE
jgi:hypothetical protein